MISPALFSRREAIRIGSLSLLLAPWAAAARSDGFDFVAINDTHYIDDACRSWHTRVVKAMHEDAPQVAFVLHAGDISDRGDAAALSAMRDLYAEADLTMHCVPGNHDHLSATNRSGYDAVFPQKLNYAFANGGWQFIALDTTQGTDFLETNIGNTTLAWLDEQIPKLDRKLPTFIFTHFPLGEGVEMRPLNADALIQRLLKLNVKWVHSGHWHGESAKPAGTATLSTSRCCARLRTNRDGSPLKGWHVYHAAADGTLSRRWVSLAE